MRRNQKEPVYIDDERKLKLISDVDSLVSEKLKKQFSFFEKIIETNKETLLSVYEKIEKSGEQINFIYSLIEYALKIRPLNTEPLLLLYHKLSQTHENEANKYPMFSHQGIKEYEKRNTDQEHELIPIFKNDDLDSFIKKSTEIGFDSTLKIAVDPISQITFVKNNSKKELGFSFLQIMAFYGSIKCFKHAYLTNEYDLSDIEEYAIAGGNMEIIHILEQRNSSFERCLEVSIKFHRNELSDWILIHNKCPESALLYASSYFNYGAVIFGLINGITVNDAIFQATTNDLLEFVKYLHETCNVDIEAKDNNGYSPIHIASLNSYLDIIKYLYETCHANIETRDKDGRTPLNSASLKGHLEIVKYLYETCHANAETKDKWHRNSPISNASHEGHLDVVKYLYETCHVEVSGNAINNASENGYLDVIKYLHEECKAEVSDDAINNASRNGHLEVVKYLYETCHAQITERIINDAKTKEIKEYFNSVLSDKPADFESDIIKASEKGKLASVQYLVERYNSKVSYNAINKASENGHLDVINYLYEECKAEVSNDAINIASKKGHLDVVKYLYETCHSEITDNTIFKASLNGHLDVVKYLYETCHAKISDYSLNNTSRKCDLKPVINKQRNTEGETFVKHEWTPISNVPANDYLEVINYLYEICNTKKDDIEQIKFASFMLCNLLKPSNLSSLKNPKELFSSEEASELLKKIVAESMELMTTVENENVYLIGSNLFSLCFSIDPLNILSKYNELLPLLKDNSTPCFVRFGIITSLSDIFNLINFKEFRNNEEIKSCLTEVLMFVITIIGAAQDAEAFNIDLRIQACKVLCTCIKIGSKEYITNEIVEKILAALPNSRAIPSSELFQCCSNVVLSVIETLYENILPQMKTILDHEKSLITMEPQSSQNKIISITFWIDLLKFINKNKEQQTTERRIVNKESIELQNICMEESEELTDIFTNIIQSIDPNDTEVEDPVNNHQPSMDATIALGKLFIAFPGKVFPKISELIEQLKAQDSWTSKHSYCLIMYALSGKPIDISFRFERSIYSFIQSEFQSLCEIMNTENKRLRETSMWVVSKVINSYSTIISDYDDSTEVVLHILNLINPKGEQINETTNKTIITRAISIIFSICLQFRPTSYQSPLRFDEQGAFNTILEHLLNIFNLPQTNSSPNIIKHTQEAINNLFIRAQRDFSEFLRLLNTVIDMTNEVMDSNLPECAKLIKEAGFCSFISTLISILNDRCSNMYPNIIHLLFKLIDIRSDVINEEALTTITTIIIRSEYNTDVFTFIDKIIDYIKTSLESNNPEVIHSSCILTAEIFLQFKSGVGIYFNEMIEKLIEVLNNDNTANKSKPVLIHAIADVIHGIGEHEIDKITPIKDNFLDLLKHYRDVPYTDYPDLDNDIKNEFLEAVAHGFTIFGEHFFVKDLDCNVEKMMLIDISKVSSAMYKVRSLNALTLKSALNMYNTYARNCSRRNQLLLCKGINYKIIDIAKNNPETKEYACNTMRNIGK